MAGTSTEIKTYEAVESLISKPEIQVDPQQGTQSEINTCDDDIEKPSEILPLSNEGVSLQPTSSVARLVEPVADDAEYLDARKLLISPNGGKEPPLVVKRKSTNSICSGFCFKRIVYAFISTLIFSIYACGGAYLFSLLESKRDVEFHGKVEKWKNDTAILLATELRQVTPYEKTWSKTVFRYLDIFEKDLLKASAMGYKRKDDKRHGQTWTFERALFFSLSLMTTTGTGSNLARSEWSEAIVIGYTFFGILVTITWLMMIGSCMAALWWWIFQNFCCPLCSGHDSPKITPKSTLLLEGRFSDTNTASDVLVTILSPLLILLVYFVFGSSALSFFADWTMSRSFYFNFAMFVTLGLGCEEMMTTTPSNYDFRQNIFYILYWLLGLCLISMFLHLMCLMIFRKRYRRKIHRQVALPSDDKSRISTTRTVNRGQNLKRCKVVD